MFSVEDRFYTPALRWKKGEMEALGLLDTATRRHLLPHIIFPSLKARDIEEGRVLLRDEFSLLQVGRLQRFWASLPFLADFRFLVFDPNDASADAQFIDELLASARKFGCKLVPVLDVHMESCRLSALAAHVQNSGSGVSIRVGLPDLQDDTLQSLLNTLLASVATAPPECILVLDLGEATISAVPDFARFTAEWLTRLHDHGRWKRIVVEASSYPTKNPAQPNTDTRRPRNEWASWCQIAQKDRSIAEWASFGDFGADHGQIDFTTGGRAITHLRYATSEEWVISRGGDATEHHDGTIRTVANRIIASGEFMGEDYSTGDDFIAQCAAGVAPGNPSIWRRANMIHHMTLASVKAGELIGSPFERSKRALTARQLSLLATEE
jgi:hypothetical protein